ncbi:MAG: acyl-CoA thioesterase [Lysobacteraceae bacterium]|nr:MAG: acyl-CoA thioesterase [Xanthomonadaceae bacterium]
MTASTQPSNDGAMSQRLLLQMPIELRWRDLDSFDHVNNASFLTYLEEARIRWFNSLGEGWLTDSTMPLLASVHINYRAPIPYPATIRVELFAERVGNTSLTLGHRILGDDDRLHADGHTVMVWIDRIGNRPAPLPAMIRAAVTHG